MAGIHSVATVGAILCALIAEPGTATAQQTDSVKAKFQEFFEDIRQCFYDRMRNYQDSESGKSFQVTKYTDVFVLGATQEGLTEIFGLDISPSIISDRLVERLCHDHLTPNYVDAFGLAVKEQRSQSITNDTLATLGNRPIEHSAKFIENVNNWILEHDFGHSDITELALRELSGEARFTESAIVMVSRGSQAPDLYLWERYSYHAHTDDYDEPNREAMIENGRVAFIDVVEKTLKKVERFMSRGNVPEALYTLGIACHAMQDLVYHRGITMRQHSGLAYAEKDRNPDLPRSPLREARIRSAINATHSTVEWARFLVGEEAWKMMRSWVVDDALVLRRISRRFFPRGEDMTYLALFEYWWLSRDYVTGRRPRSQLQNGDGGLAQWNVFATIAEIDDRIGIAR